MTKPFNHPLEVGTRALAMLIEAYPASLDLQYLVFFDYITIHSNDFGGAESLHAPLPMRSGEFSIKRDLIERGLLLMMSKDLIECLSLPSGFAYKASDSANTFFSMLTTTYVLGLKERAKWVIDTYGNKTPEELSELERAIISQREHHFYQSFSQRGDRV